MRRAAAFLVPAARPAVLVLIVVLWLSAVLVAAVLQVDRPLPDVDAVVLAALLLPGVAGWLAGFVVQDLQHTSFAWQLPGLRPRCLGGFVAVAGVWTALNLVLILPHRSGHQPLALFAVGIAAFCVAAVLRDPLSRWRTALHVTLGLALLFSTQGLGFAATTRPLLVVAAAAVVATVSLTRLFATATFRHKPFVPTSPLPGAFMYAATQRYEHEKLARGRATGRGWRGRVLGTSTSSWLLATIHESRRGLGWRGLLGLLRGMPAVLAVLALHAAAEASDAGFLTAMARTVYDVVLHSPHAAPLGKAPPYLMIPLMIAALGVALAVLEPLALSSSVLYPLSRRDQGRIGFWACVADNAGFALVLMASLLPLALLCGAAIGLPLRLDFMPAVARALLLTLWLRPLAQWFRLSTPPNRLHHSQWFLLAFSAGLVAAPILVCSGCTISASLFPSPPEELLVLASGVVLAHLGLRLALIRHFLAADLA